MRTPSDQEVELALERFVGRVREAFPGVRVLLFGSRARGEHLLTSDADVIIISDGFVSMREDDRIVAMLELWDGPVSLQPLCYTRAEFEERRGAITIVSVAAREARALT